MQQGGTRAEPRVTVVVMTRDRWPDLARTLPRHQGPVIVVDNGSTDDTPAQVRKRFGHVQLVELRSNRGALARNVGVAEASTPYVAFADDDSWWEPGALDKAADVLDAHPDIGVVVGRVLVGERGVPDPVTSALAGSRLGRDPGLPGPSVLGWPACGAVVRRTAFEQVGGFDPVVFFMGEEERLSLDLETLGWRQVYVDSVVARHHPSHQRHRGQRRALIARNRVLTAVMRRPWPQVVRTAVKEISVPGGLVGLARAVPRLPAAVARRRRVPTWVEERRRLLDG